jgi:hypothetical protein
MADSYQPPKVFVPPVAVVVKAEEPRKPVRKVLERLRYPLRPIRNYWSGCGDWTHMATGEHAGKYPTEWLRQLTWDELQSLHSDDHEKRVRRDRIGFVEVVIQDSPQPFVPPSVTVPRQMPTPPAETVTFPVPLTGASGCPGGNCPASGKPTRRGLFFR